MGHELRTYGERSSDHLLLLALGILVPSDTTWDHSGSCVPDSRDLYASDFAKPCQKEQALCRRAERFPRPLSNFCGTTIAYDTSRAGTCYFNNLRCQSQQNLFCCLKICVDTVLTLRGARSAKRVGFGSYTGSCLRLLCSICYGV
jgi:hypothetical protein